MNSRNNDQFTPWEIFGVALAIVTFLTLAIIWSDLTTKWSHDRLKWMEEHPAEVNQWLRDHNGGL